MTFARTLFLAALLMTCVPAVAEIAADSTPLVKLPAGTQIQFPKSAEFPGWGLHYLVQEGKIYNSDNSKQLGFQPRKPHCFVLLSELAPESKRIFEKHAPTVVLSEPPTPGFGVGDRMALKSYHDPAIQLIECYPSANMNDEHDQAMVPKMTVGEVRKIFGNAIQFVTPPKTAPDRTISTNKVKSVAAPIAANATAPKPAAAATAAH